jgi:hypothetical protein
MSTIKSSSDHLTINADGASKDIKFQANGVEKASISSAGAFTSTTIDATKLTGNLPAISGASLTGVGGTYGATTYAGSPMSITSNAATVINLTNLANDTSSGSITVSSGTVTIGTAGRYLIHASARIDNISDVGYLIFTLNKGSSELLYAITSNLHTWNHRVLTAVIDIAANDTFNLQIDSQNDTAYAVDYGSGNTYLHFERLGD